MEGKMKFKIGFLVFAVALAATASRAQDSPSPASNVPLKTTYVKLSNNANAIVVERETPDPIRSRIAVVVTHPNHANNFNYFTGWELARRGYRAMLVNYYGRETSYYEFIPPLAAAIKALRATPGVEKVVLLGHSSGGVVLTSYQDVAENGPKACQEPARIAKCNAKGLEGLPKADGVLLIDSNSGQPEKTIALNPAADSTDPRYRDPELDLYNPKNGFDPTTKLANYSPEFLSRFFAAQGARANKVIDQAQARLALIEKGEGDYKDDEPFVVFGSSIDVNGARPELADHKLLAKTHAPHILLKADGTAPVEIIPSVIPALATPEQEDSLVETTQDVTVREYLSFQALRVTPDYRMTEDRIMGLDWRTTPNSLQGNLEGIKVPTLIMSGTCAPHLVLLETAYDLSAAKDKEMVGVEGANHGMMPCKPEYGDTFRHTFDYADSWLTKPGRF
jgi:pimeloyl-ACP methyl ester carboxylesterase